MVILATELKCMKALITNDASDNGGRISSVEIATGVKNNLWPDAPQTERLAGSTKYRKIFLKNANIDKLKGLDAKIFIETATPAADRVLIFPGTQTDTQAEIASYSGQLYGAGQLSADVSASATSFTVITENAADAIFANGMLVRISNKADVTASGNEEFRRIKATGGVSWNGNAATITLETGEALENAYLASNTKIASVIEAGEIWAKTDTWAISSPSGTYNGWNGTGLVPSNLTDLRIVDHVAGIEQTWTLTFTSATAFTCVGDTVGAVNGGTTSSDFAPNNATYSRPYFNLAASMWGGTWATGNTLTFKTHPAAVPIWQKRVIPSNTGSLSGDKVIVAWRLESE